MENPGKWPKAFPSRPIQSKIKILDIKNIKILILRD